MNYEDISVELGSNFIEYAAAVNTDRAIPDATSGLKPVARRILWGAYKDGRLHNKPHVKSANIVGSIMATLHPHGDSSIYGALVRLSQNWIMRYPLIDGHGNFGNISGDGPAASRYTEARLTPLAEEGLLSGLKKKNVDFQLTYDETEEEPITLPAIFPNLLCNPNTGIGVAIASSWLPHNLKEVSSAIIDYMHGKEPQLLAPDFPTGGLIINGDDIPNIIKKGKGSVKLRGQYKIEKNNIVFYELPYGIKTEDLLADIGKLCETGEISGIADIRNESNKKGIRIVFECDNTVPIDIVIQKLFAKSNLQTSISYNQVALVDKTPTELGLEDCIKIYINHNLDCITKEKEFDLEKLKARKEIVDGLIKALEDIDNIIALIKMSGSAAEAKNNLIEKYNFTTNQAQAIVDMKLGKLAKLEKVQLNEEQQSLTSEIDDIEDLLNSEVRKKDLLENKLRTLVDKYGDARRTEITNIKEIKIKEEKQVADIVAEDVVVVATKNGYIKRIPKISFKTQKRSGKGTKTQDDTPIGILKTNTLDYVLLFTSAAKVYKLSVDSIPKGTNTSSGTSMRTLVNISDKERVIAISSISRDSDDDFITFVTRNGLIKKTNMSEYNNLKRKTGIIAIKLKPHDEVADILIGPDQPVLVTSAGGYAIQLDISQVSPTSRTSSGVKCMNLAEGDSILHIHPVENNQYLSMVRKDGTGYKCPLTEFNTQLRGGKGIIISKSMLVDTAVISNDMQEILVTSNDSSICLKASDVSTCGRGSLGSKLIKSNNTISITAL